MTLECPWRYQRTKKEGPALTYLERTMKNGAAAWHECQWPVVSAQVTLAWVHVIVDQIENLWTSAKADNSIESDSDKTMRFQMLDKKMIDHLLKVDTHEGVNVTKMSMSLNVR